MRIVRPDPADCTKRALAIALAACGLLSCSAAQCERNGQDPMDFRGGFTNAQGTVYESSRVDGEYLHFPRGREYRLHHGLANTPYGFTAYLSFSSMPLDSGGFTESAGNQVIFERVSDEVVRVRNDTCEEGFYLRVVLRADPEPTSSLPDAG